VKLLDFGLAKQRRQDAQHNRQRFGQRHWPARQALGYRLPFEQLHHEERPAARLADVVQAADIGVRDLRGRLRFALKTLPAVLVIARIEDHFERNCPVQPGVVGAVNDAHSSFAQFPGDGVGADTFGKGRHLLKCSRTALNRLSVHTLLSSFPTHKFR
jgi:hypothetical protein